MAANTTNAFRNPFRPGAGHRPPYLAGRKQEVDEFRRLLGQTIILENMVLTGLRGVGKTVLLEEFKPLAIQDGWLWVGTDLSEAASLTDERIALRLVTDLAVATGSFAVHQQVVERLGFRPEKTTITVKLDFATLKHVYDSAPGLVSDKLKAVLELVWSAIRGQAKGIVFAYDEAQNLSDHAEAKEYPLALMLDVFQSIQRKDIPFMLVLVGLPTLFPKLVEARTFAERMFHVVTLDRLNKKDSRDAITKPVENTPACPIHLSAASVNLIVVESDGYPYFIQFFCREAFDIFLQQHARGEKQGIPVEAITKKLDTDFFAGRWARITERQRELLIAIAMLDNPADEFAVQEVVEKSHLAKAAGTIAKAFTSSHVSQMLAALSEIGLVYKNRHGRYSLAIPLFHRFIRRQCSQ